MGKLLIMPKRKSTRRVRLTQPCRILEFAQWSKGGKDSSTGRGALTEGRI